MPAPVGKTGPPRASVIITAYNNGDALGECLSALSRQSYREKEIVIVLDTSSSDNTANVVESFALSFPSCRVIKCEGVGRSQARNIGWRGCDSEIIMFADGDDTYEPEYLSRAVASLDSDEEAGGVCLGGTALASGSPALQRYYRAFGGTDARFRQNSQSDPGWAWVYRRKCLEEVGGFDETLAQAEDKDLCSRVKKAGYRIAYVGGVNWYHRKPGTYPRLIRKEVASGRRRVVFEAKRKDLSSLTKSLLPFAFLLLVLVAIPIAGLVYSLALILLGTAGYLLASLSRHRSHSGSLVDALVSAPIALTARIAFSSGVVYGLIVLSLARSGISHPDLGRF
ncbi:MAG: glycosyltransferase [Thaumarchaeota archaeon]|nr:glycosyltransferase [Nitrososphaerota archaeon]